MSKKIKWAMLQPLTGGAYYGTESAIGHPAEYILSYQGLELETINKEGKVVSVGNERHMLEHLKKNNRLPPYIQFTHGMFDYPFKIKFNNKTEYSNSKFKEDNIYKNIDLVVSVPVCSGLSNANTQDHGKDDSVKNNNMRFLAEFTLEKIKPKAYIFENAPGLWTNKGKKVRGDLNDIAKKYNYSISYVKTDTMLHDNVQHRPRTFVIFWQGITPPKLGFENNKVKDIAEYLKRLGKKSTQNDENHLLNEIKDNEEFKFLKKKYKDKWREKVGRQRLKSHIIANNLDEEFAKFHKNEKLKKHYEYCRSKLDIDKGYYDRSFFICDKEKMPTIYHGNTWSMIHPYEERCFTFRELMLSMGMPEDYIYNHNVHSFGSVIGQNVPARTIQFWVEEIAKVINNWDKHPQLKNAFSEDFHDNIKQPKLNFGKV